MRNALRTDKKGRPTDYTQEKSDRICLSITEGKSLREICRRRDMPALTTVCAWLNRHPEFDAAYRIATEHRAILHADELLKIADDRSGDFIVKTRDDGSTYEVLDREHIERSKVRIATRQWLIERMAPKRYGARITTEHTGKDGAAIEMNVSDNEIARRIAFLLVTNVPASAQAAPAAVDELKSE